MHKLMYAAFGLFPLLLPAQTPAQQPAFDQSGYDRVLDDLAPFTLTELSDWTEPVQQNFAALRADLDRLLQSDPKGPAAAQWFSGKVSSPHGQQVGWIMFTPATNLQIAREHPLAIDKALYFQFYLAGKYGFDIYGQDDTSCLSQSALQALSQSPDAGQDAYLNLIEITGTLGAMAAFADNLPRAQINAGTDPDTAYAAPERAIADIKSQILYFVIEEARDIDHDVLARQQWFNFLTGERYHGKLVAEAIDQLEDSQLPYQLAYAMPYLERLNALRDEPGETVLAELCQ